jgi:tRNA A37 methylthiotransferase MiaB
MKKVFIYVQETCERRQLDAKRISNYLTINNYTVVDKPSEADIIFFITCGFLRNIIEGSLENIKKFQEYDAELIVAGCLPEIELDEISKIFKGRMISTRYIDKIDELFPDIKIKFKKIPDENIKFENFKGNTSLDVINNFFKNFRRLNRFYVKIRNQVLKKILGEKSNLYRYITRKELLYHIRICEGCMNKCTYCLIKKAVGPLKSKTIEDCINEFKQGLEKGYKLFVITGDDTGSYGIDIETTFPELLKKIVSFSGDYKLLIRSLNPQWVVKYIDEFEEIFKSGKIESADIPIQSNSSRILKLMNRYTDVEKIRTSLLKLRKASPQTKLNTCYILGFPSETDKEFKDTLILINEVKFSGHIFPISYKKGSELNKLDRKFTKEEMNQRIKFAKNYLMKKGYHITFFKNTNAYFFDKDA